MYNLKHNNYNLKPKNSSIYTPPAVSQFIFELVSSHIRDWRSTYNMGSHILDPCSGMGNLLKPWKTKWEYYPYLGEGSYPVVGIDSDPNSSADWKTDFLSLTQTDFYQKFGKPQLVLCNPPFNGYKNQLGSEVWLDKIIELFGKEVPIVLFAPVGFSNRFDRLNSKRLAKLESSFYPRISSWITLPKNIFPGVVFHCEGLQSNHLNSFDKGLEILIFNVKGLKGHYFFKPYEK